MRGKRGGGRGREEGAGGGSGVVDVVRAVEWGVCIGAWL